MDLILGARAKQFVTRGAHWRSLLLEKPLGVQKQIEGSTQNSGYYEKRHKADLPGTDGNKKASSSNRAPSCLVLV